MTYKITWHSNAPWVGSGYGNQTQLFTECMSNDPDFEVVVSAFYGLQSTMIHANGVKVLPASNHGYGADVLKARYDQTECDAFINLIDIFVFPDEILATRDFTWWCPVDCHPIPQVVAEKLFQVRHPWAMSKHGYQQMREVGLLPRYVPHGVNIEHFKPMDRKEARHGISYLDDETFFVVSVAANKDPNDRKNLRQMIQAFHQFHEAHPNSKFYIHTLPTAEHNGVDLLAMVKRYDLMDSVLFPDLFRLNEGLYQHPQLNRLYNAADVFLLPSSGEGFGIPVIEAQAAGCPVIVNDFTAQSELCGAGFKIQIDSDDLVFNSLESFRANVRPSKVLKALEMAYEWKDDEAVRQNARKFAVQYDYRRVWKEFMKPALIAQIEEQRGLESARQERTAARHLLRKQAEGLRDDKDTQKLVVSDIMKRVEESA